MFLDYLVSRTRDAAHRPVGDRFDPLLGEGERRRRDAPARFAADVVMMCGGAMSRDHGSDHSPMAGKYTSVSRFRRLVTDLMYFSMKVPSVTVERHLDLGRLVAARRAATPTPTWSALFTKAFARVAARTPALRTSYLTFPWPRFYEHPANIATLNIDRQLANERVVIYAHIENPETRTLQELDDIIRRHQAEPVTYIPSYRRAVRLSRVPWPVRRWVWWAALNIFGPVRCQNFGTFAISSVGSQGAGITHLMPLLTSQLHYGMIDTAGRLEMRLSFDHRVLDGSTAAAALADLDSVLQGEILDECVRSASPDSRAHPLGPRPPPP